MSIPFRLSLFCAAVFAALGVYAPFWPVWLESRGLGNVEIAWLLSIPGWIRVITAPLLTRAADRSGRRRELTLLSAWGAAASFALFPAVGAFPALFAVSCAFGVTYTMLVPMSDQAILAGARAHGVRYGRVRLWGSLSFLVMAVVSGHLLEGRTPSVIHLAILAALLLAAVSAHLLPPFDSPPAPGATRPGLREALRVDGLLRAMVVYGLVQGSHGMFAAFSTLHWRRAGIGDDAIGLLWAEGVVAEILLFAAGATVARRLGARGLLLLGAAAAAARWAGTAFTTSVPLLAVLQASHALTFGACHLGGMEFVARAVPQRLSTTALGLAAATSGLASSVLTLSSGPLYDAHGGAAFLAMSAPALVALALLIRPLPRSIHESSADADA